MNWLYLTVMGYIVVSALRGYHKGFLRVIYSVAALAVSVIFIAVAAPLIRNLILESTTVAQQIEKGSEKYVRIQIEKKLEDGTLTEGAGLPWAVLPKALQKELGHASKTAIPDLLESQGIYKKLAKAVAEFGVSAIAFLLALVIIWLILFMIGRRLDLFSKKPGVHIVNMIFGFFAGVLKAFLVIWVVFLLIKATEILPTSAALIEMIEENAVLRGLYEENWILKLFNTHVVKSYK